MPKNIFAYTAPGTDFPEFVSVNATDDKGVDIILRSPKAIGGGTAQVALTRDQARDLYVALMHHLIPTNAA